MRIAQSIGILALCGTLFGCYQESVAIKLKPDGSGIFEITAVVPVNQVHAEAQKALDQPDETARRVLEFLGEDVALVSVEKVKTEKLVGGKAIYSFKDISKLTYRSFILDRKKEEVKRKPFAFIRDQEKGQTKLNFIQKKGGEYQEKLLEGFDDFPKMFSALYLGRNKNKEQVDFPRYSLSIEVEGNLLKTNSAYSQGSTVTLIGYDFEIFVQNDLSIFEEAVKNPPKDSTAAQETLKKIKGIEMTFLPEITIEFAPKK